MNIGMEEETILDRSRNNPAVDSINRSTNAVRSGIVDNPMTTNKNSENNLQQQREQHHQMLSSLEASLPENRFELELEFLQALASPAYIHFLATSPLTTITVDPTTNPSTPNIQSSSPLQQLQPFLHYLYNTYSRPEYARFLRYPHSLYFLESLLHYNDHNEIDDVNSTTDDRDNIHHTIQTTTGASIPTESNSHGNSSATKLWTEWTIPSFRNFCHQQQFLAWQYRHTTCYGSSSIGDVTSTTTTTNEINMTAQQQQLASALNTDVTTTTTNHDTKNNETPSHDDDDDDDNEDTK